MRAGHIRPFLLTCLFCAGVAVQWIGCSGDDTTGPGPVTGSEALNFDNFQPAAVVVGQIDKNSGLPNAGGALGPVGIDSPYGAGADSYYFADRNNNRVLGFSELPTSDGAAAMFALGQPDLTSNSPGTDAQKFNAPSDCVVSGGKLFLVDTGNNRVLIWNTLPTSDVPADVVVGQPDFTVDGFSTSQTGLHAPSCISVAGGKLFVGDDRNNRVLIWNSIPTTNNAPADLVVGQHDFAGNLGGLSETRMEGVSCIWSDGRRLVVGDYTNKRVLIWNPLPTKHGAAADVVVGAPNFAVVGGGPTEVSFDFPEGVASDGTNLFIADHGNNRVLMFAPFPTANGASASRVLGQSDFTHSAPNDFDQDGIAGPSPTARVMSGPAGLRVEGRRLLVSDQGNNRILIFKSK